MTLTASIIPAADRPAFEAFFAQAYDEHDRLTVVRHYLRALLPGDKLRRFYRWRVVPCGRSPLGLRLAIIETIHGSDDVNLYLVSGGWFVDAQRHVSDEAAESAAWSFPWRDAEAA